MVGVRPPFFFRWSSWGSVFNVPTRLVVTPVADVALLRIRFACPLTVAVPPAVVAAFKSDPLMSVLLAMMVLLSTAVDGARPRPRI